jgi:hypothetical protein
VRTLACWDQVRIAVRGPCCLVGSDLDSSMGRGRFDHPVEDFCRCLTQLIGGVDVALPASFQWTLLHGRIRCISLNNEGRVGFHYPSRTLDLQTLHLAATEHAASTDCLLGAWRGHVIVKAGVLEAEGVGRGVLVEVWFMAVIDATFHGVGSLRSHIVRSLIRLEKLRST